MGRARCMRAVISYVEPDPASSDDVDYLREPRRKAIRHGKGLDHHAWSHNTFKEFLRIIDSAGAIHCLGLHTKKPRQRKGMEPKWPSKVNVRRQIARDRDEK